MQLNYYSSHRKKTKSINKNLWFMVEFEKVYLKISKHTIKIVKNIFLIPHKKYNINSNCKNKS
jgi:hypothetical protein